MTSYSGKHKDEIKDSKDSTAVGIHTTLYMQGNYNDTSVAAFKLSLIVHFLIFKGT